MTLPELLQIGEVAKRAGVTVRTVRYYEERGLLPPAQRTSGGIRLYDAADVGKVCLVRRLKSLGLSLNEIAQALGESEQAMGRQERIERTRELLMIQRARVGEKLAETVSLQGEIENAIESVSFCAKCDVEECPADYPHLVHLL